MIGERESECGITKLARCEHICYSTLKRMSDHARYLFRVGLYDPVCVKDWNYRKKPAKYLEMRALNGRYWD